MTLAAFPGREDCPRQVSMNDHEITVPRAPRFFVGALIVSQTQSRSIRATGNNSNGPPRYGQPVPRLLGPTYKYKKKRCERSKIPILLTIS